MIDRINKEIGTVPRSTIKVLTLDACKSAKVEGLDDFENLESLNLVNVGLTSLANFPKLSNLKKINLSDNRICDGLDVLSQCSSLDTIELCNNKISNVAAIQPLSKLTKLVKLDLYDCPITEREDYRKSVFSAIPSLKFLDGYDCLNNPADSTDDEASDDQSEEIGLEYLKRDDLGDDDDDSTFEVANDSSSSGEEVELSEDSSEENLHDSSCEKSCKRSHSEAFAGVTDGSPSKEKK